MKLRIQNNAKGGRGIWVDGALVEVASGATATYPKVTAGERDAIAVNAEFRVWVDTGSGWEEISTLPEVAKDRPFLAVASGARGEGMRVVDLADGEWFVGVAVAADKPEGAGGYSWSRVGAGVAEQIINVDARNSVNPKEFAKQIQEISSKQATIAGATAYKAAVDSVKIPGPSAEDITAANTFSPTTYVNDLAVDVIAGLEGKTPEQLADILAAENAREKPRKGVTSAVEEMLGKANGSEENA